MLEQSATQILLKSPDGSKSISLVCNDGVAGLWIENHKTGKCIAIYVEENQNGIGMYHNIRKTVGLNIGMSVDAEGNPYMQLINSKGEKKFLNWEDFDDGCFRDDDDVS